MKVKPEIYLKRITKPKPGKIYYQLNKEGDELYAVRIIDVQNCGEKSRLGRWRDRNFYTGKEETGYGFFWKMKKYKGF